MGNRNLLKLIERLDLDRPLIFREKYDIIWGERKSEPICVPNLSTNHSLMSESLFD